MIKRASFFVASALCALSSVSALAQTDDAMLSKLRGLYPSTQIDDVVRAPLEGLYQLHMGRNVAFTDSTGRYLLFGALFDSATRQVVVTSSPINDARSVSRLVAFPKDHLQDALKVVRGNGQRHIAVFSDPNCGYCKRLEKELALLDNVTIHTFMTPLLSDDSLKRSVSVWCAPDRNKAWDRWMLRSENIRSKPCDHPIANNVTLATRLGITATPTLITDDGRMNAGFLPVSELQQWLASPKQLSQIDGGTPK
jgi:thiol:disulfide interchange protein DsbC